MILENTDLIDKILNYIPQNVQQYTWEKRPRKFSSFLKYEGITN
jgi:hypothetical protein